MLGAVDLRLEVAGARRAVVVQVAGALEILGLARDASHVLAARSVQREGGHAGARTNGAVHVLRIVAGGRVRVEQVLVGTRAVHRDAVHAGHIAFAVGVVTDEASGLLFAANVEFGVHSHRQKTRGNNENYNKSITNQYYIVIV